jgi:signal peptidase II
VRPLFWIAVAFIVAVDQWTKSLVQQHLALNIPSRPLIPGVLNLTYVQNDGVAFGQLRGVGSLHLVIAFLAVAAIMYFFWRAGREGRPIPPLLLLGLALPLGGAIGNSLDRIRLHVVIDFLQFGGVMEWFPVFNIADSAITVGGFLLMLHSLRGEVPQPEPMPAPVAATADLAQSGD